MNDYLTIKEVATALGLSRQAVYNKLDGDFKPFLTVINGKKMLSKAILHGATLSSKLTDDVDNSLYNSVNILQLLSSENEHLKGEIDVLREQLITKDKQIDELNARLAEAHQQLDVQQKLHAGTIQQQLTDGNRRHWWNWRKQGRKEDVRETGNNNDN